jgi:hypothetical protein
MSDDLSQQSDGDERSASQQDVVPEAGDDGYHD